jgi:hypothetical protein
MTQRRMESVAGWLALGLWFASMCMLVVVAAMAQHMPERTIVTAPATTKSVRVHGKQVTRDVPAVTAPNPRYVDYQLSLGFLALGVPVAMFVSFIPTAVWWWRRRIRIRAETLAEAFARYPDASRLRDSGAIGI